MAAPSALSSPLVSPLNSLSPLNAQRDSAGAPPTYGLSTPSCSLATAGSPCVGCTSIPVGYPELMNLALDLVVAASNSLLTRVSSALTASNSVALDTFCSSTAPMMESRSHFSLAQLMRFCSFSLVRAATCPRSSTPSVHSLVSSTWDKLSASLS